MPQHQGNKRQGSDKPQGSGKQLRERFFLAKTKLCLNKTGCKFGPQCFFAHSLKELSPAPKGWTRSQEVGHYWQPGAPKPSPDVMRLIQEYAVMRPNETPEWATELLEEAAPGPPAPPGNWTNATEEEEVQPKPREWSSRGSGSSRAGLMVSLSNDDDVPGPRPPHLEHRSRKDSRGSEDSP